MGNCKPLLAIFNIIDITFGTAYQPEEFPVTGYVAFTLQPTIQLQHPLVRNSELFNHKDVCLGRTIILIYICVMLKDLDNWDLIPTETYKGIYEEAKVRYNEQSEQSEFATKLTIQMIIANTAVIAWFAKYVSDGEHHLNNWFVVILVLMVFVCYTLLTLVLFPRNQILRGTAPHDALKNEQDLSGDVGGDNYDHDQKVKVFYYHQVYRYYTRIKDFDKKTALRMKYYRWGIRLSFVIFAYVLIAMVILST